MAINNYRSLFSYHYFDKLLRLENLKLFSRQDKILYILDTTILILYQNLYINIISIIVLNIEASQYNIQINLAISCSPKFVINEGLFTVVFPQIIFASKKKISFAVACIL